MFIDEINIRISPKPGDIGYINFLHGINYYEEYGLGADFEAYVANGLDEFLYNFDASNDNIWICEHNHRIVAFLALISRDDQTAQLRYFLVMPAYRGIGLGSKLMRLLLQAASAKQLRQIFLLTFEELHVASLIYHNAGFIRTSHQETAFGKALDRYVVDIALYVNMNS